jgi:uncharacterized protein (TIGR03067 family)
MLVVAFLVSSAALLEAPPAASVDSTLLKKLQGKWLLAGQEHGGKKTPAKEILTITLEVSKTNFTTREGSDVKEDASVVHLEGKGKPAAIDLKITAGPDLDKIVKGVWKLDGEGLTICIAEPGKDRPKAFAAREGTGHTLLTFRRPGAK